ncbi:MAG: RsbRD N-terminal domain-containing protein, partial [Pseudomonadota bacterium]
WFDHIMDTYPADARDFMKSQGDRFANPVGSSISAGITALFHRLVEGGEIDCKETADVLDEIIRIRAVQNFTPAEAVAFVFFLKLIAREALGDSIRAGTHFAELLTFETRVDKLSLLAFNVYVQCREKVYEIRAKELRELTSRIVQRACQVWDGGGIEGPRPDEV